MPHLLSTKQVDDIATLVQKKSTYYANPFNIKESQESTSAPNPIDAAIFFIEANKKEQPLPSLLTLVNDFAANKTEHILHEIKKNLVDTYLDTMQHYKMSCGGLEEQKPHIDRIQWLQAVFCRINCFDTLIPKQTAEPVRHWKTLVEARNKARLFKEKAQSTSVTTSLLDAVKEHERDLVTETTMPNNIWKGK